MTKLNKLKKNITKSETQTKLSLRWFSTFCPCINNNIHRYIKTNKYFAFANFWGSNFLNSADNFVELTNLF